MAYTPQTTVLNRAALNAATAATLPAYPIEMLGFTTNGDGGGGQFTIGPTVGSGNGGTILNDASGRSWYRLISGTTYNVKWFGCQCDGVTNDTTNLNNCTAALSAAGGGVAMFQNNMLLDPFTLPSNVTLQGNIPGPYSSINSTNVTKYPVLKVNSTGSTFLTMGTQDSAVKDLAIYWPSQVAVTASTPNVYPYGITSPAASNGGNTIKGLTLINAYDGIFGSFARGSIQDCLIGAFNSGIVLDSQADFFVMDRVFHQVMWDIYAGVGPGSTIDTWVKANGSALTILRADGFMINNWGVFWMGVGIVLSDSAVSSLSPKNGYGHFNNIEIDTVLYGVNAQSTDNTGGGVIFTNMNVASANTDMNLSTGGTSPPQVSWIGGDSRGTGHYSIGAGTLSCRDVQGINHAAKVTAPSMPASLTYVTNPYPFPVRVYISGGTIADWYISGSTIPNSAANIFAVLDVGEQIALNYTGSPVWSWFGL
jgi:hypothetical protein